MLNRVVCGAEHGSWFGVGARAWGSAVRVGVARTGRLPQYMVAVVILLSHLRIQLQYSPRCLLRACALPAVGPFPLWVPAWWRRPRQHRELRF